MKLKNIKLALLIISVLWSCTSPDISLPAQQAPSITKLEAPVITPKSGKIDMDDLITISFSPNDAEVFYTIDGTMPNKNSSRYIGKFKLSDISKSIDSETIQISAIAYKDSFETSDIASVQYTFEKKDSIYLESLSLSNGVLSPEFSSTHLNYTSNVENIVNSVEIISKASNPLAVITVNSKSLNTVNLEVGSENNITITLKLGDITKNYTVKITRQSKNPSNISSLSSLDISSGVLSPLFSISTLEYSATVPNSVSAITVSPVVADSKASATVNGYPTSTPVSLLVGKNTINVVVTAENNTTSIYKLSITREQPEQQDPPVLGTNAELESLSAGTIILSPAFNKSTFSYTANADSETKYALISALAADSKASVTITPSSTVALASGDNKIDIIVTSENGKTTNTYVLNINKEPKIVVGTIFHVKGYTHIWAWDKNVTGPIADFGSWPGKAMNDESATEGAGWYGWAFPDANSIKVIFNNNGSAETETFTKTNGEYWFANNKWTEFNPEDNEDPSVTITSPTSNSSVSGLIEIKATATDNIGIAKVEFYLNSTNKIGETTVSPYKINWNSGYSSNGSHILTARAYDVSGRNKNSSPITITTNNANLPPIANCGGNKRGLLNSTTSFNASASTDPNGSITSYKWNFGDGKTGTGVMANHIYTALGNYTVTLTVTDNEGATNQTSITVDVVNQKERSDFREESIYFLMTTRFNDGDSSNNRYTRADYNAGNNVNNDPSWRGDFQGLIDKLDYIKAMGFTAIWITPPVLNRSDSDYHGYHSYDMTMIDKRLESPGATYQDLIDAIHGKGMKIVQDVVINHTGKYGDRNLGGRILWGDSEDADWGANGKGKYYDVENPNFEYDGLTFEPNSGKNYYTGGTYQSHKPTEAQLPWLYSGDTSYMDPYLWIKGPNDLQPRLENWGVIAGTSPEGWKWRNFQWSEHAYTLLNPKYFHLINLGNWEAYDCQQGTMHPDCVDVNTESPDAQEFLINAYNKYIDMGVDAFRIDTAKHISRVMFNRRFVPAWKERGGDNFYMVGEVLVKSYDLYPNGAIPLGAPFYTWKEGATGVSSGSGDTWDATDWKAAKQAYDAEQAKGKDNQPRSNNHSLNGNNYRTPDYSQKSGLDIIDMQAHVNFSSAGKVWGIRGNDEYYNDATWNVVYVDSHDYGPSTSSNRFGGGTSAWAENFSLMFTWRGIPCVYYGSEIEFKAGVATDGDPNKLKLEETGRAYYGEHIKGSITATGFGEWTNVSGNIATTMEKPLVKHLAQLNKLRLAIPALQKGQYSTEGISKELAFKKRFTDEFTDSFVLVTISGDATFSGIPGGTYKDAITGDVKTVSEGGSLTTSGCSGQGNLRVYVLDTSLTPAPGKIAGTSPFLK